MTYLRTWKKGKRLYFALVRTRRIKRGAKKGKVVQEVMRYIGTANDLYRFIEDAEMNGILSDLRKSLSLKHPVNVDRVLIDGTVITSEGIKCELLTFGYNPTGARKRQITIFLAVTEGENIPVHLRIVKGNVKVYEIFSTLRFDEDDLIYAAVANVSICLLISFI